MTNSAAQQLTQLSGRTRQRVERQIALDPVIGKDILELLSSSMYVDPRAIYREYIQNSADAIDAAFAAGLFREGELGRVDVTLDPATRTTILRDDGVGVPAHAAERILTSFGASEKRGTNARGFRGVGRLAAFGYAQTVTFRTKAAGETNVTEVRWDCRKLKAALIDFAYNGDLSQIVRDVVTIGTERAPTKDAHFFEVRLERVVRLKNDVLANADEIERYLGEVAPAPFRANFSQAKQIGSALRDYVPACRFRIFVNGSKKPVTRPHQTQFAVSQKKMDAVTEVDVRSVGEEGAAPQAVVWIAHHGYQGTLLNAPSVRGLRARMGDMQIGDEQIFQTSFPETRFNAWTIGEVHIVDRRIIPNGRRDGFEHNEAYADLMSRLVPLLREVSSRCRHTSAMRARIRGFEMRAQRLRGLIDILAGRSKLTPRSESRMRSEVASLVAEMKKALRHSRLPEHERARLTRKLQALRREYDGVQIVRPDSPPFAGFPRQQRILYEQVIEFIRESAPSKSTAESVIERLIPRIEAQLMKARKRRTKQ